MLVHKWFRVLVQMEEGDNVTEIAKKLNIGHASCSNIMKALHKDGMVHGIRQGHVKKMYLTDKGRTAQRCCRKLVILMPRIVEKRGYE